MPILFATFKGIVSQLFSINQISYLPLQYKVPWVTAPIVKALRCIHSGAAIQGPSALPFEVLWRCYSRSQVKTPGDRIQDQDFQVSGVYRPLRTKRALPHPIAIQNMRFDWEKNCGIIPLKWRYLWNLTGDKFDPKNDPKYLIFLVVLRSKRPLSWIFPYYCTILLLYYCSHFQQTKLWYPPFSQLLQR